MIRYRCNKCDKTWIYPIEKCALCNDEVVEIVGSKFKVIAITKVNIPSPMHPIVPYNVVLLEDEHGNKMPKKTMKDYKVGDEFLFNKGEVSVVKVRYNVEHAVKTALSFIEDFDVQGSVFIKPTILKNSYAYLGQNTNPKVLAAVIDVLLSKGATSISVVSMVEDISKTGIPEVCRDKGVEIVDEIEGGFIVNIPVMKASDKGITESVPENEELVVGDATIGQMNDEPGFFNMILAGHDITAVESVFAEIMGFRKAEVKVGGDELEACKKCISKV